MDCNCMEDLVMNWHNGSGKLGRGFVTVECVTAGSSLCLPLLSKEALMLIYGRSDDQ
jgi:hypothetical protein